MKSVQAESKLVGSTFYDKEMLSMALHDWNHDSKNDWQDNYIRCHFKYSGWIVFGSRYSCIIRR